MSDKATSFLSLSESSAPTLNLAVRGMTTLAKSLDLSALPLCSWDGYHFSGSRLTPLRGFWGTAEVEWGGVDEGSSLHYF